MNQSDLVQRSGFPAGFSWGTSTSAFQIEGSTNVDGRGESIWERFARIPGAVSDGGNGDSACDSYRLWRRDIELLGELGVDSYRFSLAWPRLFPNAGSDVNAAGLDHYDRLVDALLAAGIEPWITLYHWDLPAYLEDEGGWPNRDTARQFARFADAASRRLGDRVRRWITLNEPWCAAFLGYHEGIHAPGRKSVPEALAAVHTMLVGHGHAVNAIRSNVADAQVGLSLNPAQVYPATESEADLLAASRYDGYFNRWFLDPLYGRGYPADMFAWYGGSVPEIRTDDLGLIATPTDFLGVNYYSPYYIAAGDGSQLLNAVRTYPPETRYTDMCLGIHAGGLEDLLLRLANDYPVHNLIVTENGAAYTDPPAEDGRVHDEARTAYLRDHIAAVESAIAKRAPVTGYFVWSLLDNFEWELGYSQKFGIVHVDFETQTRTIKDSGLWYRDFIRSAKSPSRKG